MFPYPTNNRLLCYHSLNINLKMHFFFFNKMLLLTALIQECCLLISFRFQFRTFKNVFTGTAMCDWLLRAGLAADRETAVAYGRRLLLGRVITHTNSEQHFHDAPYFYKFLDTFEYMTC